MKKGMREILAGYAISGQNYNQWRREHEKVFGEVFSRAFDGDEVSRVHLTAALIDTSQRKHEKAIKILKKLEASCGGDFDRAAVCYYIGLNYEMLGNEGEMAAYYERLFALPVKMEFPLAFHPGYRTAKSAQRDAETGKAIRGYRDVLGRIEGYEASPQRNADAARVAYDLATVLMYSHRYDDAQRYLEISRGYSDAANPQRDYVAAILCALNGRAEEAGRLIGQLPILLKASCRLTVEKILDGCDPHYCIVEQDRSGYIGFYKNMHRDAKRLRMMIAAENCAQAEEIISGHLTRALPFMQRKIGCRVEKDGERAIIICKNYCVKSLMAEYEFLFSMPENDFSDWRFVSSDGLEE